MKINLVKDWQNFYKWYSIKSKVVVIAILAGWDKLPADLKTALPQSYAMWIAIAILILGAFGTIIDQSGEKNNANNSNVS